MIRDSLYGGIILGAFIAFIVCFWVIRLLNGYHDQETKRLKEIKDNEHAEAERLTAELGRADRLCDARKLHIQGLTAELQAERGRSSLCWSARDEALKAYDEALIAVEHNARAKERQWNYWRQSGIRQVALYRRKASKAKMDAQKLIGTFNGELADAIQAIGNGQTFKIDIMIKHTLPTNWAVYFKGEADLERVLQPLLVSLGKTWVRREGWFYFDGVSPWFIKGPLLPGNMMPFALSTEKFLDHFPKAEFKPEKGSLVYVKQHPAGSWLLRCYDRKLNRKNGFVHRCHDGHTYRLVSPVEGLRSAVVSPFPKPYVRLALGNQGNVLSLVQPPDKERVGYNVVGSIPAGFQISYRLTNGQPATIGPVPQVFTDANEFTHLFNAGIQCDPGKKYAIADKSTTIAGLTLNEHARCTELLSVMREAEERGRAVMVLIAEPGEVNAINAYATLLRNTQS